MFYNIGPGSVVFYLTLAIEMIPMFDHGFIGFEITKILNVMTIKIYYISSNS
jgi:hypothetical protein